MQPHVSVVGAVYFSYRVNSPPGDLAYCDGGLGGNGTFAEYDHGDTCAHRIDSVYYDKLKGLIEGAAALNPGAKVTIVAHSQGGLIASQLVGKLRSDAPEFLRDRVASVVTFDSFPEGLPAAQFFATSGDCFVGAPVYYDWDSAHAVAQTARRAAQPFGNGDRVAFYTIDAADSTVPERYTDITGERIHRQFAGSHSEIWTDGTPAKQDLVGCAVVLWDSCTFMTVPSQQGITTEGQMTVGPPATRARIGSNYGSTVRMTLVSPSGTVYGPEGAGPVAAYSVDAVSEVYEIDDPEPGEWTIQLYGEEVDTGGEDVLVTLLEEGIAGVLVGGIAELPGVDAIPLGASDSSGPGTGTITIAGIATGAAAAAVALGGVAWYARRRLAR